MGRFLKKHWLRLCILLTAVVLAATLLLIVLFSGKITAQLNNEISLELNAYHLSSKPFSTSVIANLNDYNIELSYDFKDGQVVAGREFSKIKAGRFFSNTLGEYMLYKYASVRCVIVLTSKDGQYALAFNLPTQDETEVFYSILQSATT